jgi:hypothetical protein
LKRKKEEERRERERAMWREASSAPRVPGTHDEPPTPKATPQSGQQKPASTFLMKLKNGKLLG